jgi:hypothetical protein
VDLLSAMFDRTVTDSGELQQQKVCQILPQITGSEAFFRAIDEREICIGTYLNDIQRGFKCASSSFTNGNNAFMKKYSSTL